MALNTLIGDLRLLAMMMALCDALTRLRRRRKRRGGDETLRANGAAGSKAAKDEWRYTSLLF